MKIALIDCGSQRFDELHACCARNGEAKVYQLPQLDAATRFTEDAIIISGGPHLFTEEASGARSDLEAWFAFLHEETPPALGICLGMQAIALAAGSTIYRGSPRRDRDAIQFSRLDHPLLNDIPTESDFAEDHCEGVTPPNGFEVIGSSDAYPVEIIANDSLRRYGTQFHPESSGCLGHRLIANFLDILR